MASPRKRRERKAARLAAQQAAEKAAAPVEAPAVEPEPEPEVKAEAEPVEVVEEAAPAPAKKAVTYTRKTTPKKSEAELKKHFLDKLDKK